MENKESYMKMEVFYDDCESELFETTCFPDFIGGFLRIVTNGTYIDIKECVYLKTDNIKRINYVR